MTKRYVYLRNAKFAIFSLLMLFSFGMAAQITRFVKQGGTGNGYSWETASGNLQSMIDEAGSGWNIYVAAGTYQRNAGQSFSMKSGVKIYGGFPATGNPGMENRKPALYPSVLQGNGNRVLLNNNVDTAARLDGFTLQGGTLTGGENGAGICNNYSSPKIVGCIIRNNTVSNWGGGIYCQGGYATFTNCLVYGNTASGGGGAFNHNDQTSYTNCTFTANNSNVNGGAVHLHESGSVTFSNSISWANNAAAEGDEFYTTGSSTVVLYSSISANQAGDIFGNMTSSGSTSYDNPMFTNAATNNFAPSYGSPAINTGNNGAISGYTTDLADNARVYSGTVDKGAYEFQAIKRYVKPNAVGNGFSWANASGNLQAMINASSPGEEVWVAAGTYQRGQNLSFTLKNGVKVYGGFPSTGDPMMADRNFTASETILQGNNASVVFGQSLSSSTVFDGFTVTGGEDLYGGGMNITQSSLRMENLVVKNNVAEFGGGILLLQCNSYLKNISIIENTATIFAGGIHVESSTGEEYMENIIVSNNTSEDTAGGISLSYGTRVHFVNLLVSGNTALSIGGIFVTDSGIRLTNATIAGNTSNGNVALYSSNGLSFIVENSIIDGAATAYGAPIAYTNSLVTGSGGSGAWNTNFGTDNGGNIDASPMFTDAAAGNYSLHANSPAVNSGNSALFTDPATATDLAGNPRLFGSSIDMGAYESDGIILIRYVRPVASGDGDGSSWANASGDLQAMMNLQSLQVWVAAGTYQPGQGQSFMLSSGVKVYGGFPATGNPSMGDRNFTANATILQGNNAGVVYGQSLSTSTVFDGFTVTGGQRQYGGGMDIEQSSLRMENLILKNNTAEFAGGMYLVNCTSYLKNISIFENTTTGSYGGLHIQSSTGDEYMENVIVRDNTCNGTGGGVSLSSGARVHFVNFLVSGNTAAYGGGILAFDSRIRITNATVSGNSANSGVQLHSSNSQSFIVENSIIDGTTTINGGSPIAYANSLVTGSGGSGAWNTNYGTDNGGNIDVNPIFTSAVGGNYSITPNSQAINSGNSALFANAGTATDLAGNPRLFGNTIDMGAYESQVEPADIRYVKQVASGTGNGTSWANASANLQAMMNLQVDEVWVAAGTYQCGQEQSFTLKDGVKVYGGFPSTGNPLMADRDFIANETILQGNNAMVVFGQSLSSSTVFDGFTVTGGQAIYGGGIDIEQSSLRMENLVVKNNVAEFGGGILLLQCNSYLKNISIIENTATIFAGGMHIESSTGEEYMENITVSNNFSDNTAGGISLSYGARVHFVNLLLSGNTALSIGGIFLTDSHIRLTNATVAGNTSNGNVALYSGNGLGFIVENSIIDGAATAYDAPIAYTNSLVTGSGGSGAWNTSFGTDNGGNIDASPMFTDAVAGDYSLKATSQAIDAGNTALFADAAISTDLAGNERLDGNAIDMGAYEFRPDTCGTIATTWNGANWDNGNPVSYEYSAVIAGNYNSAIHGTITACSLTVNSGNVEIAEGDNFTIQGAVTVDNDNATFTINHNANLIQVNDVDNVGTIIVIKESAPMYRLDYALWASPVAGQKLKSFSPQTLDNRFYAYNPLTDAYSAVQAPATTNFAEGKSYLIRVDNTHPDYLSEATAPTRWTGTFTGVPNNGNVNVAVVPSSAPTQEDANGVKGFNAIGNPYPSSINIAAFFEANQNNLANNTPIFFWRKKNEAGTSSYASLTLAGYNANSGNPFGDSSDGAFDDPNDSYNWVINPGQGFIVRATNTTVAFNNGMRTAVNNGQMFRSAMDASDKSRLWLNITNSEGLFGQTTIAYTPNTTLGLDYGWDGSAMTDGSIAIYSLAGESKLGIQARAAFDPADEVPVEYKVTAAGSYNISLDHFDGVFTQGQNIYLRDNVLGVTHNLETPYDFTTESGVTAGRFDVVYAEALNTDIPAFDSNSIIVYKQGNAINISTGNVDMKSVSVYDIRGRLLYASDNINAAETSITTLQVQEQMLIVQVTTVEGVKASKKIVY